MAIELLDPSYAKAYRQLILEAYSLHPEAFVSSIADREKLPLSWWEGQLDDELSALFGAFIDAQLVGIIGLAFEPWEDEAAQSHVVWPVRTPRLSRARGGRATGAGGAVAGRTRT